MQLCFRNEDQAHVLSSLEGYTPEVSVVAAPDALGDLWQNDAETVVVDFGLSDEFFLPLGTVSSFRVDPYIALVAGLSQAGDDEWVCLQILFERARNPWGKAISLALSDNTGAPMFADAPEFLPLAREKSRTPLFSVVLRVGAQAASRERAFSLARATGAFIRQFERPGSNELLPLSNDDYADTLHAVAFLERQTFRSGMLLSSEELVGLVHIPDASVRHPALVRENKRTKPLPPEAVGHRHVLGENVHRGVRSLVSLPDAARLQHMHVIGASGTGKSTLLVQLITQDVERGHGVAVLDPHGDLIDDVLARIPEERFGDVVIFDPSDEAFPVGLNILSAKTTLERQLLASDLVGIFERLSTSWGDSMGAVLSNAVLAMLEHEQGGTLVELRRFLLDEGFRKQFLRGVADEEVQFFWTKGFQLVGTRSIGPILTRLDAFLRPKLIRHIVGQRTPRLDMASVLSEGKIFLGKLSQGLIGEENASLLGSLLATRFHQLALARQHTTKEARRPFFLYADEAQHFVTPSMASLLTDVRKYGFGLVLSHQNLFQIRGSPVESALLGNAYTRIAFRVGDEDAKRLAEGFSFFEARDLRGLARGEAIVRIGVAHQDCNLKTLPLKQIEESEAAYRREAIQAISRQNFAAALADVRQELASTYGRSSATDPVAVPTMAVAQTAPSIPKDDGEQLTDRPTPPTVAAPKRTTAPVGVPTSGRGGQEHKYLQHLIKRLAEERGFRANLEDSAGTGQADVVLRRDDTTIACEVSITTDTAHEMQNVDKCLAAGFAHVALICPDSRRIAKYQKAIHERSYPGTVVVLAPEALADYLDTFQAPEALEPTVRGYKVRLTRQAFSPEEAAERRQLIAKTIARSLGKAERK
jgi:hypothetical protein